MDNGPAKRQKMAQGIQSTGEMFGDPFEISTIRREVRDWFKMFVCMFLHPSMVVLELMAWNDLG